MPSTRKHSGPLVYPKQNYLSMRVAMAKQERPFCTIAKVRSLVSRNRLSGNLITFFDKYGRHRGVTQLCLLFSMKSPQTSLKLQAWRHFFHFLEKHRALASVNSTARARLIRLLQDTYRRAHEFSGPHNFRENIAQRDSNV